SPAAGTYFQELNVTLANVGSSKAISASFLLYTLKTDQLLVLQFSPSSDAIDTPCATSVSIASGGSYTCNLIFEVPKGQNPVTLYYDDPVGDTASADMPPPPPVVTCAYDSQMTNTACRSCVNWASSLAACKSQLSSYSAACSDAADSACVGQCPSIGSSGP